MRGFRGCAFLRSNRLARHFKPLFDGVWNEISCAMNQLSSYNLWCTIFIVQKHWPFQQKNTSIACKTISPATPGFFGNEPTPLLKATLGSFSGEYLISKNIILNINTLEIEYTRFALCVDVRNTFSFRSFHWSWCKWWVRRSAPPARSWDDLPHVRGTPWRSRSTWMDKQCCGRVGTVEEGLGSGVLHAFCTWRSIRRRRRISSGWSMSMRRR